MFTAYENLSAADQYLHTAHFTLCVMSVAIACIPLLAEKGGGAHKLGGMIYLPIALVALLLSSAIAWSEASPVLFCFNCLCAYLLLSGWRALHETAVPALVDWVIPGSLLVLGTGVSIYALLQTQDKKTLYLLFFAVNAFYLAGYDWKHLHRRVHWQRQKIFMGALTTVPTGATAWIGRHVTGMIGSMVANMSVVVLTLLPLELHWLWPATLIIAAGFLWWRQHEKKLRLRADMAFAVRRLPPYS